MIGRGGMGEILLAEDTELGRKVAVKLLDERFADDDGLRQRFQREALTAARLSGEPHIVTIFDVGEWQDRPFIVMEYLPGGSLAERARAGRVRPHQAITWLGQAGEALDAAHAHGVVHRDVKPANLLLNDRDEVQVADFGIARMADDTAGMTAAGTIMGTAGYLAPEQARGEPATAASDRYALGVVAYELLTGGRPFERGSETAEAVAHINEPVPPASQRGVGIPLAADRVFERALAKNPHDRYGTCAAFVADLDQSLAGEQTAPTRVLAPPPLPRRADGRRPDWLLPALVAGLIAALVGGLAAASLVSGDGGGASQTQAAPVTVTKRQTQTLQGTTITHSVTTTVAAPPPTAAPPPAPENGSLSIGEAVSLTDQATGYLRQGDWKSALQTERRALGALEGTYRDDFRYEAYAYYNTGKALAELGRCSQALSYLDRSEQLQGHRSEIDEARASCSG
jgi:serine/threonine protein kinase